jgi:hypothetical protein
MVDIVGRDEHVVVVDAKEERCAQCGQKKPKCEPSISRPQQAHREGWSEHNDSVHEETLLRR